MKLLQLVSDDSCHAYREELAGDPKFRVIEVKAGENVQPDAFLSPAEREARNASVPAPVAALEALQAAVEDDDMVSVPDVAPVLNDAPAFVASGKAKK